MQLTPKDIEVIVDMFEVDAVLYERGDYYATLIKYERR